MKKKNIIIAAVILIIVIAIVLFSILGKRKYNTFTFPSTVKVENSTKNEMADTMMMVVLNKIMLLDTVKVSIFRYNSKLDTPDTQLAGHIMKNPFENHAYMLYIKDDLDINLLEDVISHESIHLKQMEDHYLTVYELGYMWKGDIRAYSDVKYEDRPHEIDAYNRQAEVKRKLQKLLYK